MRVVGNIKVGEPKIEPDASAHANGINQGNAAGNLEKDPGYLGDHHWSARRSTSINSSARQPIDPHMPVLPPA